MATSVVQCAEKGVWKYAGKVWLASLEFEDVWKRQAKRFPLTNVSFFFVYTNGRFKNGKRRALAQMKIRLKGAQKGHSLLKKKSDALTLRFRQILRKIIEVRSDGCTAPVTLITRNIEGIIGLCLTESDCYLRGCMFLSMDPNTHVLGKVPRGVQRLQTGHIAQFWIPGGFIICSITCLVTVIASKTHCSLESPTSGITHTTLDLHQAMKHV